MKRKVSIVIIALLLVTQLMHGFAFTQITHAQDITVTSEGEGGAAQTPGQEESAEAVDVDPGEVTVPDTTEPDSAEPDTAEPDTTVPDSTVPVTPESGEAAEGAETVVDGQESMTAMAAASEIQEQIITSVQMYDEIPGYDGNGNITPKGNPVDQIRPNVNDQVAVVFGWSFPSDSHGYGGGSTYTFNLPDKFKIESQLKGNLDGGAGEYVVNPDGKVTFTFSDLIEGAQLQGSFYVWVKYDASKMEGGLKQPFDFSSIGQGIIDVHFANTAVDKLTKSGVANKNNFNSDEIVWTVDFNQGEKEIKNAVLEDVFPEGLNLKGDIEIRPLEVQINGSVKAGEITQTASQFPVSLGSINQGYRVTYTTSVTAPTETPFTNRPYENQVNLTGDDGYQETAKGRVNISFNEPLNKSGQDSGYDPVTQTITWKVQYNYNQQAILKENAWIEDHFDTTKYALVPGSVQVNQVTINDNGSSSGSTPVESDDYTVEDIGTGFKVHFKNDISSAYEIVYQTKAIDRVYKNATVSNTVKMYGGLEKTTTKDIREIIFAKSVQSEDFNKKEIEWKLVINSDRKDMTDIVITDDYEGRHMKLVPGTLEITGPQADQFVQDPIAATDDSEYEKGFSIRLVDGGMISGEHTITYKTSFDPTAGMPTGNVYRNTGTIVWKESGIEQTSITKWADVTPQSYTIENGNKKGEYSAKDKTITWTIDANYNLYDIQDAIIQDNYIGDQSFVDGSLKVNKLLLEGENNVIDIGDEVSLTDGQFQLNSNGKGFRLDLGNIGKEAYRIVYKTSLDGEYDIDGTYSNHATLSDGEGGEVRFNKSATVTPVHGGVYVAKTGKQEGTSDLASWTVNINPSQSYIPAGSELTDTLSDNQILLADSLKLYHVDLPADNSGNVSTKAGAVSTDDYELVVEGNTFTFRFLKAVNTAFILEYQSFINADSGDRISNKVDFAGQSSSVLGSDSKEGIRVSLAGAGGGSSTGLGQIKIKKVDDTGAPLEGAVFEIYNASGSMLLETLKPTDSNGETSSTRNYRLNENDGIPYKLKEVSAPMGYLVDSEYGSVTGKTVAFKDADKPYEIENKKIRQGFQLTKVDSVDTSKTLKGATFELYLKKTDQTREKIGENLTTGEDGRIAAGDLPPGDYELVEVVAPEYYTLDAAPIPFTIVANQTQIVTLTQTNAMGTDGKLVITKVNAKDQSVLSGIEFELRDNTGSVIGKDVTDVNGVIEFDSLPYGPYTLVETKADGFVIEQPETLVSIIQPETKLTIENKENDRSVKLVKTNESKTQHLQGAVFELLVQTALMDQNGDWEFQVVPDIDEAQLTTDLNGELYLEDLEPNRYQLVEVKAPSGYVLDNTPVEFEITNKQTETVVVEKMNKVIVIPGGPSTPSNPGTPIPETPTTPTPETPAPETSNPGTTVPGTVVVPGTDPEPTSPGTSVPEPTVPEDPTDLESAGTSPDSANPAVPGEDPTSVANAGDANAGDQSNPGNGHEENASTPSETDVAGAQNAQNQQSQGMLPKTGEESRAGYTFTGAALILLGCLGYWFTRRRQQMKHNQA
ncbi:collagen binding domain-containing protein [Paenibacillus xylanilyticus]|uniref:LPXTG cell wall anchor domain-containing protein n=1 Tax=Paenibacillus xylanilyticus TaxID=248903 RepID=A0A7Y6BUZ8_9BACL|nr:collagen binding domain-containing protein [Paenibacillus xylanilyticus]NUU75508.1 LPXTG cell wall anchor domain-containing protein [Paenibacillus xylanilyticus]